MNVDEDWGDVFLHVKRGSKDDRGKKEEDITTITIIYFIIQNFLSIKIIYDTHSYSRSPNCNSVPEILLTYIIDMYYCIYY